MKKLLHYGLWFVVVTVAVVLAIIIGIYFAMRASLPQLDGDIAAVAFKSPVTVTRDSQGTVTSLHATRWMQCVRWASFTRRNDFSKWIWRGGLRPVSFPRCSVKQR